LLCWHAWFCKNKKLIPLCLAQWKYCMMCKADQAVAESFTLTVVCYPRTVRLMCTGNCCYAVTSSQCLVYCRSCIDGLWKIMRHEGPSVLWHGVNVSVLISVPMICMYLPMYDTLLAEFESKSIYAPSIAGSAARAMSVVATSPLELLKTRIQAAGAGNVASSRNAASIVTPFSAALQQMRSDMKV
jgi:hypothetical protein